MNILVSNDDGYDSLGIKALAAALQPLGKVTVVAPLENKSGASSSLSLHRRVKITRIAPRFFCVDGTPTDCVHLALTGNFLEEMPDLVVSGINNGENMGDDTIYSGTVAAAMESYLFNIPSIAVSMAAKPARNFDCGAKVAFELAKKISDAPRPLLLNVNVPDRPYDELRGFSATRLGRRHIAENAQQIASDADSVYYEIGDAGPAMDGGDGTDFFAVKMGMVSVTPLAADLTSLAQISASAKWLK